MKTVYGYTQKITVTPGFPYCVTGLSNGILYAYVKALLRCQSIDQYADLNCDVGPADLDEKTDRLEKVRG